jgi:hypothetical protein
LKATISPNLAKPGPPAGVLAALGAVVTVCCTAMIYRSLKPVPRWHKSTAASATGLVNSGPMRLFEASPRVTRASRLAYTEPAGTLLSAVAGIAVVPGDPRCLPAAGTSQ